ncbi:ribonucleotide reductase subunit alpha [Janthinobacterium fluminis]|uniref:Ribonucleotide reductase subunit alpha n=1 Tax=Janthinobacterium fluminis TaxID=2987524 RepID=A0ABT5JWU8_9BURK|nr:ribonucleotide reductase subunit alpha [Janthinobacterium fluminis]MDC8757034.1 ribonucleotide reductase subunit alpha [Janthinobacterium fluminis]
MEINSYASLLEAARAQAQPQRLLFTFAQAEAASAQGRTLTPVMCVDKLPGELGGFAELEAESRQMQAHWDVVFVASLGGKDGQPPAAADAEAPLRKMIGAIQQGQIKDYLAFDRDGELLRFF